MSEIISRSYTNEADFQAILELMTRVRPAEHANDFPVKVDLEEALASDITRANMRLWFLESILIAWAYVDEFNNLFWEFAPGHEQVGAEIVDWGVSCVRSSPSYDKKELNTACREDRLERILYLEQHGFRRLKDVTIRMVRPLSEPIQEPVLPPGFSIRPLKGRQEAEAVAAMHRDAFGTEVMTAENRLIIMSTSEYDVSLDLVVVTPDDRIVGNCICSVNQQEKMGFTDPISTHPQFQRRGLARALLLTGLGLLKERGMTSAHLGTSGDNLAMQKTAKSAGFGIESRTIWFSKDVS